MTTKETVDHTIRNSIENKFIAWLEDEKGAGHSIYDPVVKNESSIDDIEWLVLAAIESKAESDDEDEKEAAIYYLNIWDKDGEFARNCTEIMKQRASDLLLGALE